MKTKLPNAMQMGVYTVVIYNKFQITKKMECFRNYFIKNGSDMFTQRLVHDCSQHHHSFIPRSRHNPNVQ